MRGNMIRSEFTRTDSLSDARTGRRSGAASLREFPRPALIARGRAVVALVLLLILAFAEPARAQCSAGWLPGAGLPGTNGSVNALAVLPGGDVISVGALTHSASAADFSMIVAQTPEP